MTAVISDASRLSEVRDALSDLATGDIAVDQHARQVSLPVSQGTVSLVEAVRRLEERHVVVSDVALRRPTLDDVFVAKTGYHLEQEDEQSEAQEPAEA